MGIKGSVCQACVGTGSCGMYRRSWAVRLFPHVLHASRSHRWIPLLRLLCSADAKLGHLDMVLSLRMAESRVEGLLVVSAGVVAGHVRCH